MATGLVIVSQVEVSHTTNAAWTDIDVSAYVPAGATGVLLQVNNNQGNLRGFGVRKNGSTDAQYGQIAIYSYSTFYVGVDSNRVFECYAEIAADIDVYLRGYFGDAATFNTDADDKTPGTLGSYQDVDISTETGGETAVAAFVALENGTTAGVDMNTRPNGATWAPVEFNLNRHGHNIAKCDGSEIFECRIATGATGANLWLMGWMTSKVSMVTEPTDVTPGTTGSYQDLTAISGIAGIYRACRESHIGLAIRTNGETYDYYTINVTQEQSEMVDACDGSGLIEAKLETTGTNNKLYYLGYFEAADSSSIAPIARYHQMIRSA